MTISYNYALGETVQVKPYSIFNSPTPIEWNADPYGYGVEYTPGQTFRYSEPVDLYAQYSPLSISYHLTGQSNGQLRAYDVTYISRVGQRIEIAEFPQIDGFQCWLAQDGTKVDAGKLSVLTSSIDLYMSCYSAYSITFDPNGGIGSSFSMSCQEDRYVDYSTGMMVKDLARLALPYSVFTKEDMRFTSWLIDGEEYAANEVVALSKSLTAYAMWKDLTQYTLDVELALVNEDSKAFRYVMLKIDSVHSGDIVSLSKLKFIDGGGNQFTFPSTTTCSTENIQYFVSDAGQMKLVDTSQATTVSFKVDAFPCAVIFDIGSQILDVSSSKYHKVQVLTTIDVIDSYPDRSPTAFQLYFSNNGTDWFKASQTNSVVAYRQTLILHEGQISLSEQAENVSFNAHDDSDDSDDDQSAQHNSAVFRYMKIQFNSFASDNTEKFIQMSELKFIDADGNAKAWPNGVTILGGSTAVAVDWTSETWTESPKYLFDGSTSTKFCGYFPNSTEMPAWFTVDLGDPSSGGGIDLSVYTRYQWWTANDSTQHHRCPGSWQIFVSNDGTSFTCIDEVTSFTSVNQNYALAYTSNAITVQSSASGDSQTQQGLPSIYNEIAAVTANGAYINAIMSINREDIKATGEAMLLENSTGWRCLIGSQSFGDSASAFKLTQYYNVGGMCIANYENYILPSAVYDSQSQVLHANKLFYGSKFSFYADKTTFRINEESVQLAQALQARCNPICIGALTRNGALVEGSYWTGAIGKVQISNGDELVLSLVPAKRKVDLVCGLYDLVSQQFMTSQSTIPFMECKDFS